MSYKLKSQMEDGCITVGYELREAINEYNESRYQVYDGDELAYESYNEHCVIAFLKGVLHSESNNDDDDTFVLKHDSDPQYIAQHEYEGDVLSTHNIDKARIFTKEEAQMYATRWELWDWYLMRVKHIKFNQ